MAIWLIMLLITISYCNNNDAWGLIIVLLGVCIIMGIVIGILCYDSNPKKMKENNSKWGIK